MISNNNKNNDDGESWRDDLRERPWTQREDAILIIEQVKKCGEAFRWSNHLRPDLKKGPFSEEEEKLIDDLHAKIGNRWTLMATKLSGLLNDVVMEGNALCRKGKSKMDATIVIVMEEEELADKRKIIEEPPLPPVEPVKRKKQPPLLQLKALLIN
nr:protein ODORANT1-like [Arachis hypogaea]